MPDELVSFGVWVRALRRQHDLTQDELGARVGCTGAYIRKIEADERRPSVEIVERLASIFGIALDQRDMFMRSSRGEHHVLWQQQPELPNTAFSPIQHRLEPITLTEIIGREAMLDALQQQLLHSTVQLLTLTGPPGVGKTRLAEALVQRVGTSFSNGICWVSLASVRQPDLLLARIAQALDSTLVLDQDLLPALMSYVRVRQILLVLDNAEHLADAIPVLSDLLRAAPKLKMLVTSQVALHLTAEHEFPVTPFALPEPMADIHNLAQLPAVLLFVQRAQAVHPTFKLVPANASSVAELCRRLDGLPLAIELAAARCKIFSPQTLLERLGQRLILLRHEVRDTDNRHHSLYAAIDWSYSLLSAHDQAFFDQLSVFSGPCTLSAIETICGKLDPALFPVIDRLAALVDHSLLQRIQDVDDEPYFAMLESVRAYAAARLDESEARDHTRRAHADYYLRLARTDAPQWGQEQPQWLQRIDLNYTNLRAALDWSYTHAQHELSSLLVVALTPYWVARGMLKEGRIWAERLLAADADDALRADLLAASGELAFHQSDYARSRAWYTASLDLSRQYGRYNRSAQALYRLGWLALRQADYHSAELAFTEAVVLGQEHGYAWASASGLSGLGWIAREQGNFLRAQQLHEQSLYHYRDASDVSSVAYALNTLGWMTRELGDFARAAALHEESVQLYRALQSRQGMAHALNNLGWVAGMQADYSRAKTLIKESLALREQIADHRAMAWSFSDLGWVLREQGDYSAAQSAYQQALAIYHDLGDRRGIAGISTSLGLIAVEQHAFLQAQQLFRESSSAYAELRDWRGLARCLEGMVLLAMAQQQIERGARLLGIAEHLRAQIRAAVPSQERSWYDRMEMAVMAEEGAAAWRAASYALPLTSALREILPAHVQVADIPLFNNAAGSS